MRKFGVELECVGNNVTRTEAVAALTAAGIPAYIAGYGHYTSDQWKVTTDGSIMGMNGMEVVSPILEGDEGLRQVQVVCDTLTRIGCTVNRSTGLHVHVDARDLEDEHVKNVVRMYVKYESCYDSIMPVSRRESNNTYCASVTARLGGSVDAAFRAIKSARGVEGLRRAFGTRYMKVNLDSLLRHRTVEFRQHSGSLDGQKVVCWVKLVTALVCRAKATRCVKAKGAGDFDAAFKHGDAQVKRWAKARRDHFAQAGAQ